MSDIDTDVSDEPKEPVVPEPTEEKAAPDSDSSEPEETPQPEPAKAPEPSEPDEPPVRRSAKDFIIARKQKKLEKLQERPEPEPDDTEPEELTPAARKAVQKEVAPILDIVKQQADDRELSELFIQHPEARGMEKQIRKHMEVYENVPAEFIFNALNKGKKNPELKQKADDEAKLQRTGGHTKRPKDSAGLPNAWDLSDEEFDKSVSKVRSQYSH
jgi:hypothetical protein